MALNNDVRDNSLLDPELISKYQLQVAASNDSLGLGQEIIHGAVASVVDLGASVWNSTVGHIDGMETDTADLLSRIDSNALQVYNEHPDAVHAASMVGGVFLPAGVAMKGMSLLRAGAKGVSWFSEAGNASRLAKVETIMRDAGPVSRNLDEVKTAMYGAMALNAVADNVAIELAITSTMNAHPYMEDYNKDFASNFMFSVAVGTGLGALVGSIGVRKDIRNIIMPIEAEQLAKVHDVQAVPETLFLGSQVITHNQNASVYSQMLGEAANTANTSFTLDRDAIAKITFAKQDSEAKAITTIEGMLKGDLAKEGEEVKKTIGSIMNNDISWNYAETISYADVNKQVSLIAPKTGMLQSFTNFVKSTFEGEKEVLTGQKVAWSPTLKTWISQDLIDSHTHISDTLVTTLEGVDKYVKPMDFTVVRKDLIENILLDSTANTSMQYAATLRYIDSLETVEQLNKIPVHTSDLPLQAAILAKLSKMSEEEASRYKGIVASDAPSYNVAQSMAINQAGFSPTYIKKLATLDKDRHPFSIFSGEGYSRVLDYSLAPHTNYYLDEWIAGNYTTLRKAALNIKFPKLAKNLNESESEALKVLTAMKNSQNSVKFREYLHANLADADGYVLLYRGAEHAPTKQNPLESFSLNPGKASAFTGGSQEGLRMYKVKVDDIVASIDDFGDTHAGNRSNSEILVMMEHTVKENAVIPKNQWDHAPSKFFGGEGDLLVDSTIKEGSREVNAEEMRALIGNERAKIAKSLTGFGHSEESIAARLGLELETYKQFGPNTVMSKYSNSEDILRELDPRNRTLVVTTNVKKAADADLRTNLNENSLTTLNTDLTEEVLKSSEHELVRGIGELVSTPEARSLGKVLLDGINNVTQSGLLSTLWRSANSAVEHFGISGSVAIQFGKNLNTAKNAAKSELVLPISQAMHKIIGTEALVTEMNLGFLVNASIKGERMYKDGQFLVPVMKDVVENGITKRVKEWIPAQYKGADFSFYSPEVKELFDTMGKAGRAMYELKNAEKKILGAQNVSDIGFWIPAINPRGKEKAYVIGANNTTSVLYAKTPQELADLVSSFREAKKVAGENVTIVTSGTDLDNFNKLVGREEIEGMQMADVTMQHSGASASAVLSTSHEQGLEILNAYDHYIDQGITNLVDLNMQPVMDRLKMVSNLSKQYSNEANMSTLQKGTKKVADPGMVMRNILLDRGQLGEHLGWSNFQTGLQVYTDITLKTLSELIAPLTQKISPHGRTEESFVELNKTLEARGFVPFKGIDDFNRYKNEGMIIQENLTPKLITLSNAYIATSLLRFMELSQPLVNAISLPILTSGAMRRINAKNFMGAALDENAKFGVISTMYDGVRLLNNPAYEEFFAEAARRGITKSIVSEATGVLRDIRSADPSITAKASRVLESDFVNMMSKGSDYSESVVRKVAFATGVAMAKKAYPGLNDVGVMTYARSFMDEAIGNYSASQRPALFQGTFGVAMGLFQTYMLTMAQQLYRGIERKDWIGLSKQMFAQASIFGTSSLPGFHIISEQIGNHFSDNHVDLESGLFRAIGDEKATMILYGLPSSFGPGVTTRGDIQPRIPNLMQIDSLAAYNIAKQGWDSISRVADAATSVDGNTGRAFLEALSLQSVSRPVARLSELVSGNAITSQGNIVANSDEVYTGLGIVSRVFATRPIEEIKAREVMHLDSVYKAADGDKRKKLIGRLRTHIRDGELNPEVIQNLQYEYMRTGSASGWRSSVNDAMRQTVQSGNMSVRDTLKPDAPYQQMIDDIEPGE